MNTISIDNPTVSLGDLARSVADVFRRAEHNPIIVTRNSKPIAKIIPYNKTHSDNTPLGQSPLTGYLTNAIKEQVIKKYKNKKIPTLREQLADL